MGPSRSAARAERARRWTVCRCPHLRAGASLAQHRGVTEQSPLFRSAYLCEEALVFTVGVEQIQLAVGD
jgi:hypothetical protein